MEKYKVIKEFESLCKNVTYTEINLLYFNIPELIADGFLGLIAEPKEEIFETSVVKGMNTENKVPAMIIYNPSQLTKDKLKGVTYEYWVSDEAIHKMTKQGCGEIFLFSDEGHVGHHKILITIPSD